MPSRQDGMIMPLMLLFLALISVVVGRVHSLGGQHREVVKAQILRSQTNSLLFNAEDIVLRKLPQLDITLFQRLTGEKENAPLVLTFPTPSGDAQVKLTSARQCLNLAPLWEKNEDEKEFARVVLLQLMATLRIDGRRALEAGLNNSGPFVVSPELRPWVCYLPNAGQQLDVRLLETRHSPLLEALLPGESPQVINSWLADGITTDTQKYINDLLKRRVFVSESNYYWLELNLQLEDKTLHARELIHIKGRSGHIVRRRLMDDNAL